MKKYFISILFFAISFAELISPEDGATLNYRHVLFEWEQVPNASAYEFTIINSNSSSSQTYTTESLQYILSDISFLNWQNSYSWNVFPIYDDGSLGDSIGGNYTFTLGSSRSNANANGSHSGDDGYITMFSSFFDYYTAAIDEQGNEIWNSGNENIIFYNTDYYGQLFGALLDSDAENYLPVIEYNLDNNILWQEPADFFAHHEMIQLPNGNYMSLVEDIRLGPIPSNLDDGLSFYFMAIGYLADGITNEFPWVGDRLVEWDQNGNEVWSWSVHDYFNKEDYDEIAGTWAIAFSDNRHDWTHANAFWFSENENAIYLSSRHLSRITKIDYETGEIVWNMGLEMPSGDVDCGHDLGFSFQHSIQVLENGNIVTLDNGNISETINNTPYPTSRGLEIELIETNNSCEASLEWSYDLPEDLFGFASGNVQKLESGNYLITTVGGGGTSIEVTPNNQVVWEADYNLSLPNGAVYRANRLPGLHPIAFSVVINDMYIDNNNIIVDDDITINLYNDGSKGETFFISLLNEYIYLDSGQNINLSIPTNNNESILIEVIPVHREDLSKQYLIYLNETEDILGCTDEDACNYNSYANVDDGNCIYPEIEWCDCNGNQFDCEGVCGGNSIIDECGECDGEGPNILCDNGIYVCNESECNNGNACDEGFTYFELNEIPNSTIVLDQSQCFSNIDLGVLQDIISINNLSIEAIGLGTQNWFNGHITRLTIGNFYDGGNVSLNMLPDTIGDLPNIAILYLNYNELTSLPDSITNLTNLIYLVLSFNQLTHLPDNIGNLSNMVWLDLGYNSIEYLPESIGDFSIMNYLWIFNNQLTSIPETICNLNLDWNGLDYNFLPYFGSGGNMLCDNTIPECVANSDNFNTSIDPLYYSFLITVEQDCSSAECGQMDINSDGTANVIDIVALVNRILAEQEITDVDLCTYDVTQDGLVNVIDIVALVNSILEN